MTDFEVPSSIDTEREKLDLVAEIVGQLRSNDYTIEEANLTKPWGAYLRLANDDAEKFIAEFFPGLSLSEAQRGIDGAELSPKILIVSPGERLSWQYHDRRAERWRFLTEGGYYKSMTDEQGELVRANLNDVVQFDTAERHRLVGSDQGYTVVAEIWQHTDGQLPSNEDDIVRLADDYSR
jgi:mannose-6-phosphate isomerase-like protein (cupin superfamily)